MPLKLSDKLPAIDILKQENIFVIGEARAQGQDIRPLRIVILNLMPLKITTETDLIRLLSNTPLQIEIVFMRLKSYTPKHTPIEHMMMFYKDFAELSQQKFDGMIVTGAPVETMDYEAVGYWNEIVQIFDWARTHVTSTLYLCWAAMAGLYHFYGIPKHALARKMFGVYAQKVLMPLLPIFRGFDDTFFMPQSRHTELWRSDLLQHPELQMIAESSVSGVGMVMARDGREFFITGHLEYSPTTLDAEYKRDLGVRNDVDMPQNYYTHDDCNAAPMVRWRAHAHLFYSNWINYYVYQATPYNVNDIK